MEKLTPEQLERLRGIRIHKILGVLDTGREVKIRCVFHNEKSPSLVLYPDGHFKCYGCGISGFNAIDFTMNLGYDFKSSIEELCRYL